MLFPYDSRVRLLGSVPWALLALSGCAREAVPSALYVPVPTAPWEVSSQRPPSEAVPPQRSASGTLDAPAPRRVPDWAGDAALPYVEPVHQAASSYNLPPKLLWAVIKTESNFRRTAVSRVGARGLMQLMPKTARALGVRDSFNAHQNIHGGALFLRRLADRFDGDLELMLAAYNAGPGAVKRYGGVPPYRQTRAYVRKVLALYRSDSTTSR